jgi:hypothetical protein
MPQYAGRSPQHQASLPLIQMRQQLTKLCRQYRLSPLRHTRILRPQPPQQIEELLIDSSQGHCMIEICLGSSREAEGS